MFRQLLYLLCGLSGAAFGAAGCGGNADNPPVYPVMGTIVYEGKPVEGAVVAFCADHAPRLATGVTDAEGRFTLTTFNSGDGAVAGNHKVTVTKVLVENTAAPQAATGAEDAINRRAPPLKQQSLLPLKYGDPLKTPLEATVSESGANDFALKLD